MSLESSLNFEFEAPQFIDSWDKVNSLNDGADDFFDAVDHLGRDGKDEAFSHDGVGDGIGLEDEDRPSISLNSRIAREQENLQSLEFPLIDLSDGLVNTSRGTTVQIFLEENCDENGTRRLSLKRKFSPLKDRNESVIRKENIAKDKVSRLLPTIAESPVLLTKGRGRTCHQPRPEEERKILKPKRRVDLGGYIRPVMPKPPTIPEPFNLTEPARHAHVCWSEDTLSQPKTPSRTPKKKCHKKHPQVTEEKSEKLSPKKSSPFSFYERDKEIMRRKQERLNPPTQESEVKFEFKAKSPSILKREPFRPLLETRFTEPRTPQLSTEERAKKRTCDQHLKPHLSFADKKMHDIENSLFVFKSIPAPKGNSSFLSTASSSKRDFACGNSSVVSSIGGNSTNKSQAFSFYERDLELLKRKEERIKMGEKKAKVEFKAREATVLKKEPFWPEVERRQIELGVGPSLATEERAEERKKFEQTIREVEERNKLMQLELKKIEEEAMREYRKTLEFKATSIKK